MNSKERICATIAFEPTDVLPVQDHLWQQVPDLWRQQGMPQDVLPEDHLGFDVAEMYLDTSPRFEQRILFRAEGYITYTDRYGYTCKKPDGASGTLEFSRQKTTDKDAWNETRRKMLPRDDDPEARIDLDSYFAHFESYPTWEQAAEKYRALRTTNRYILFLAYGPWEATWRHRGYDHMLLDLALEEDWVREMGDAYNTLLLHTLRKCLEYGIRPDGFMIVEDLGCNHGLLFSPDSWRRIYRPGYAKIGQWLRENGIHFWMHNCGRVIDLLDDLIECGLQVMNPMQVTAGMDLLALGKRYGKNLAWWGNLSAATMSGPRDSLEASIRAKAQYARQHGGYIFGSDHSVPPEVSYQRYRWILRTAKEAFAAGT